MYEHGGNIYLHPNCNDFSSNMNCLGTPEEIKEAMKQSVEECWHYPDPNYKALKEAIAAREGVSAEHVICSNGATELIFLLLGALPPGKAMIFTPTFYEFERALKFYHWETVTYELKEKEAFGFPTPDVIMKQIPKGSIQLLILCNPGNPTGFLLNRSWLRRFMALCRERKIIVLLDECFMDFVVEDHNSSLVEDVANFDNLFLIKSFTKFYALAGVRMGYALCSNKTLMRLVESGSQPWSVSNVAEAAAIAACKLSAFDEKTRNVIDEEKEFMRKALVKEGFLVYNCAANFLFFKVPAELSPQTFGRNMMKRGFLVRDCGNFRGLEPGFYRVTVQNRIENQSFLDQLKERNDAIRALPKERPWEKKKEEAPAE